jgi:hypothetical protein
MFEIHTRQFCIVRPGASNLLRHRRWAAGVRLAVIVRFAEVFCYLRARELRLGLPAQR